MVAKPFTLKMVWSGLSCVFSLNQTLGAIGREPFGEAVGQSDHAC